MLRGLAAEGNLGIETGVRRCPHGTQAMNETYVCVSLAGDDLVNCILDEIRYSGIGSVGDAAWNKEANLPYL